MVKFSALAALNFYLTWLKFSLKLSVAAGEYFISLAIADGQFGAEDIPLDRRYDLIQLNVQNVDLFDGMVDLECHIKECS